MKSDIPPAYGYLEFCEEKGQNLEIHGWLLRLEGPFEAFAVRLADGQKLPAQLQVRPQLATILAHIPGAERAEFHAEIPLSYLGPDDTLEFQVLGLIGGVPVGSMYGGYHRSQSTQQFPPSDVMKRATGNEGHSFWRATGIKNCHEFLHALTPHLDLDSISAMLEWGCGSGRLTTHLIDCLPDAEVYGTDIDVEAVEWAAEHMNGHFTPCQQDPPLPFSESMFDLVVSLSVFTHLTRGYQERWLDEIKRVLKPDGILLVTTHGEFAGRWTFHNPGQYELVMGSGFFDEIEDHNLKHVASGDYYRATFQTYDYTDKFWSRYFDILSYIEGGMNNLQDVYVMRNPKS